jgi:hypothetical protein
VPVATAPAVPHDARYFAETRYRIDNDAIWGYFQARGRIETFGYPVSRTFTFLGCTTQIFQRQVAQQCADGQPRLINLLDPEIFPYTRVNGSTFPAIGTPGGARLLQVSRWVGLRAAWPRPCPTALRAGEGGPKVWPDGLSPAGAGHGTRPSVLTAPPPRGRRLLPFGTHHHYPLCGFGRGNYQRTGPTCGAGC